MATKYDDVKNIGKTPFAKEMNEFLLDMNACKGNDASMKQIGMANKRMLACHGILQAFQERPETMLASANMLSFLTGEKMTNSMDVMSFIYNEKGLTPDEMLQYHQMIVSTEDILSKMKEVQIDINNGDVAVSPLNQK